MISENLGILQKIHFLIYCGDALTSGCKQPNIGGAGWDEERDIEEAKHYPAIESERVLTATEQVPYGTFKQEFETVFQDFPYSGNPISSAKFESTKTQISGTPYLVSYENNVLKIQRDDVLITERKLPRVFYMHSINSGAMLGKSRTEDIILCGTISRATAETALYFYR